MCKECKCDRGFIGNRVKNLDNNRQVLDWKDSSVFLIYTADNYLVMSSQFRAGSKDQSTRTLGTFGGYIEADESNYDALIREMKEETNLSMDDDIIKGVDWVFLDKPVSPGYTTERSSGYIVVTHLGVNELIKVLKCNDSDEDIEFEHFHMKHIMNALIEQDKSPLYNRIDDLKAEFICYGALTMYRNNLKAEMEEVNKRYEI